MFFADFVDSRFTISLFGGKTTRGLRKKLRIRRAALKGVKFPTSDRATQQTVLKLLSLS